KQAVPGQWNGKINAEFMNRLTQQTMPFGMPPYPGMPLPGYLPPLQGWPGQLPAPPSWPNVNPIGGVPDALRNLQGPNNPGWAAVSTPGGPFCPPYAECAPPGPRVPECPPVPPCPRVPDCPPVPETPRVPDCPPVPEVP